MTLQALAALPRLLPEEAAMLLHARLRTELKQPTPLSSRQRLLHLFGFSQSPRPDSATVAKQRLRTVVILDRANRYAQELLAGTAQAPP
jgi:hypothetical protein